MEYNNINKAQAIPEAASLIETFRAIGYSIETAIADIIDNSISANAKNIYIKRYWAGGKSYITIKDDGLGMSNEEIIQAMRPGSQNPLVERTKSDLGRFGLGLKTASFSQCRRLTILSKNKTTQPAYWTWDLDYIYETNKWELLQWISDEFKHELDNLDSGTLVIWSNLDRIIPLTTSSIDEKAKRKFSELLDRVKKHISMTFHRFIEAKEIRIFWGEHEIEPWNPFCINESKTQERPTETIQGGVKINGYILPHKNNFSSESEYKKAEGINGYASQQGFYIYRGKRLLLSGDWLGYFRKEEQYKLARIQIDLPNNLDVEWQIDIKKSRAYPPAIYKEQLEAYAKEIRTSSSEVYRHRGKILKQRAGSSFQPLWLEKKKDNKWSFVVNRDHMMIKNIKNIAKEKPEQAVEILLKFIEESIPSKAIYIKEAQEEESQKAPFSDIDTDLVKTLLSTAYNNQISIGKTPEQTKAFLKTIEPFNNFEELIEQL